MSMASDDHDTDDEARNRTGDGRRDAAPSGASPSATTDRAEAPDSSVSAWPARAAVALNEQLGSEVDAEAAPGEAESAAVPDEPARPVDESTLGDKAADAAADLADALLGDSQLDDANIAPAEIDDDTPSVEAPQRAATTRRNADRGAASPPLPMPRVSATTAAGRDALVVAPERPATRKRSGEHVMASPVLTMPRVSNPEAVVLFVHGGDVEGSLRMSRRDPAYLRMVPFARDVERRSHGRIGGALLRLAVRGWNDPEKPAVQDTHWALDELRRRYPDVPIALAGHSMGGRVVLDVAESEQPAAVVALAPWAADAYDAALFDGIPLLAVHGRHDTVTDPAASKGLVERIKKAGGDAEFVSMPGWHAMLLRAPRWHAVTSRFLMDRLLTSGT